MDGERVIWCEAQAVFNHQDGGGRIFAIDRYYRGFVCTLLHHRLVYMYVGTEHLPHWSGWLIVKGNKITRIVYTECEPLAKMIVSARQQLQNLTIAKYIPNLAFCFCLTHGKGIFLPPRTYAVGSLSLSASLTLQFVCNTNLDIDPQMSFKNKNSTECTDSGKRKVLHYILSS